MAYSPESLAIQQGEVIEQALWTALTTLEERASFLRKMTSRFDYQGISNELEVFMKKGLRMLKKKHRQSVKSF